MHEPKRLSAAFHTRYEVHPLLPVETNRISLAPFTPAWSDPRQRLPIADGSMAPDRHFPVLVKYSAVTACECTVSFRP